MGNTDYSSSRAYILDILRGIALFGVYIANLGTFTGYNFLTDEEKALLPTATLDTLYDFFHFAFIDGKFYSIFSLLFGIGFSIFLAKSNGIFTFYKRLLILIGIGLFHSLFLWIGDILLLYALLGLLLPLFSKISNKKIIAFSIILVLTPILLDATREVSDGKFAPENAFYAKGAAVNQAVHFSFSRDKYNSIVRNANYTEMKKLYRGGIFYRWGGLMKSNRLPKVLALFLLGMMIGRNKWYEKLEDKKLFLLQFRKWMLLLGFPITLLFAYVNVYMEDPPLVLEAATYAFSVIPMAFVYVTTIVLYYLKNEKGLSIFKYIGKMTLTNYIMHSVIAFFLFYGTGLALTGKVGSIYFPIIAISIVTLQILLSKLWLQYFEFGPLEWIWRQLTYGTFLNFFKKTN